MIRWTSAMVCQRPSALMLAATLSAVPLVCSREPPPSAAPPSPDAAAEGPAPPPSTSIPPIEVSPPIRPVITVSARDDQDFAASIPGVLTIRAPNLHNQSHGVGEEPWKATFLVTNETATPLSVTISDLTFRSDEAGLAPADREQALVVKSARAEGVSASVEGGAVTVTAPPHKQIEVALDGDVGQKLRVLYHVAYRHEAAFSVGAARVIGRGYSMYFRHPRVMRP
jgi:hypothetical protein